MKKLLISLLAFSGFLFPLLAQVDHDHRVDDVIPVESLYLNKDQIPVAIVQAVRNDFSTGEAFKWAKFPYTLEKYGWVINQDEKGEKPDHYEVFIKTKEGGDVNAVYAPDGTIIESRIVNKNFSLPTVVKEALAKSQYKDWSVVGDKEIIKYYNTRNNIEQHFRVSVEKNNVKRSISFNYKEPVNQ